MDYDADDIARLLRTVGEERDRVRRKTRADERVIYLILASAYLIGFGGQFLGLVSGGSLAALSWIPVAVVGSLAVGGIFWYTSRQFRGIRGNVTRNHELRGAAWITALGVAVVAMFLTSGWFPEADLRDIALVVSAVAVGLMYLALGATLENPVERHLGGRVRRR
jgi:hypothetical protein